jgi:IclR family acetate operon transcriptional repressor
VNVRPDFKFSRYHVPNLARALRVLEYLASRPEGCGVTEIAEQLKIPVNSVFRVAATLSDYGYLARDDEAKVYRLNRKLLRLGYAAVDEMNLVEKSIDLLRQLRDATGETALLAVMVDHQGVVLEQVLGVHPVKVTVQPGHLFPMHGAAPGKAMIAFLPEEERKAFLRALSYPRFTPTTITTAREMAVELESVRRLGYAVDRGEIDETIRCVAAPVLNHRGYPIAGIWVTGPASRVKATDFEKLGPVVCDYARRISGRFGFAEMPAESIAST